METKLPKLAIKSSCVTYFEGHMRCENTGEVWLIAPDGEKCPGGPWCRRCGESVIKEYAEKIGEVWTLADVEYI